MTLVAPRINANLEGKRKTVAEAKEKSIVEGIEQNKIETAKNLIHIGLSDEDISNVTNLPIEQVIKLHTDMKDN